MIGRVVAAVVAVVALAAAGTAHGATPPPSSPPSPPPSAADQWVLSLPGDPSVRFSAYDFRQDGFGAVDWPVEFVFRGNATVEKVTDALCQQTTAPWRYCNDGGPMHLFVSGGTGEFSGFVANSGLKRFREDCSSEGFTAHMRIYTPSSGLRSDTLGSVVIATAHLDFEDHAGCSGRIHGYPDLAQQWFDEALSHVPGWTVTPGAWNLGNGSDSYVIIRDLHGSLVPHVYGHDDRATDVVVP